ncbi:sigma-54 dependent transcriptional regulator [bacterium]|nr:sigma-54 dependent transcriptional regulator [bacterium]
MSSILIIDDDSALCRSLEIQLKLLEHVVKCANTSTEGIRISNNWNPDLILLDLNLPDSNGLDTLKNILKQQPDQPIAMITGQQDMTATIEAMRTGALDYIRKPFQIEDVTLLLEKIKRFKRVSSTIAIQPVSQRINSDEIIGKDKKITDVIKQIGLLSRSQINILIHGESGTGKELVARILHKTSSPDTPFVAINCSAIVPTLFESELFGHEKGAFTGADSRKIGKLEYAGNGTVFLDEIGDMPFDFQAKILRVLQERQFERVGGNQSISFNARIIAASHHFLEDMVAKGKFRQDLFYRLAVSRLTLPPLNERKMDIPVLVHHLIQKISRKLHHKFDLIESKVLERLKQYYWSGNIREFENVLTRAIALTQKSILTDEDISFTIGAVRPENSPSKQIQTLKENEKLHILSVLNSTEWNITHTSKILDISPTTLRKKIQDYRLK